MNQIALSKKEKLLIGLLLSAALFSRMDQLTSVVVFGVIPLAFIICFFGKERATDNKCFKFLSAILTWTLFTYFFSTYPELSITHLKKLLGTFLLSYCFCTIGSRQNKLSYLYLAYIFVFFAVIQYIFSHGLLNNFDYTSDRIASAEDSGMNANEPAYYSFFLVFSTFLIGETTIGKVKKICRYAFFLTIPISFAIALLTGARQTLVILLPSLLFLIILRYSFNSKKFNKIFVAFIIAIACLGPKIIDIYGTSTLASRADRDVKDDTRIELLKDAVDVGLAHPIVGVGPGCYVQWSKFYGFSHCSYTELFANSGAPAVILYILMLTFYLRTQFKRYRITRDRLFLVFLLFGFIFTVYNMFYVFYQALWMMAFFFLISMHSDIYYKEKYIINENYRQ